MQGFEGRYFRSASFSAALLLALGLAGAAQANTITPGQSNVTPDIFNFSLTCPGGTNCPSAVAANPFSLDGGNLTGTTQEGVFTDPNTHFLDFIYQVTVNPTSIDSLSSLTATGFTACSPSGCTTDLGYQTNGGIFGTPFANGTVTPNSIFRLAAPNDGTVGFTFSNPIGPGHSSDVLIIATNATNIAPGAPTPTPIAPTPITPEPASFLMMGGALLLLSRIRRRA
jgi:hypothetical protein